VNVVSRWQHSDAFDKWVKGDITVEDKKLIDVLINKQPKEA